MDKKIDNLLIIIGQSIVNKAKYYCTVDTGRLRDSIIFATANEQSEIGSKATESDKIEKPSEQRTVRIGTAVSYAPFVEYGTSKMANKPFLRPALLTTNIKGIINKTGIFKA